MVLICIDIVVIAIVAIIITSAPNSLPSKRRVANQSPVFSPWWFRAGSFRPGQPDAINRHQSGMVFTDGDFGGLLLGFHPIG